MSNNREWEERQLRESFTRIFSPIEIRGACFDMACWESQRSRNHYRRQSKGRSLWPITVGAVFACLLAVGVFAHTETPLARHQLHAEHLAKQAPISQLLRWNARRELYAVTLPDASGTPSKVVFLIPKGFTIPDTLASWPPGGFTPVAVINNPATQFGSGTGTLWFGMQSYLYWLRPSNKVVLPPSDKVLDLSTSAKAVLAVRPGHLYAIAWPSTRYPHRTIFLESRTFAMPYTLTEWPPKQFTIVATYSTSALNAHPQLSLDSYPTPPHSLTLDTRLAKELLTTGKGSQH